MRIGLFATCLGDTFFPDAVRATAEVLERLGHRVDFPAAQTCCGQMHLNNGYPDEAQRLARRFIRVFDGYDAVIAPSSSCVGAVRELYSQVLDMAHPLLERVFEVSEFLTQLGHEDVGARFPHRVTYHPTCHSLRVTRVGDAPLRLLRAVDGLDLVELRDAAECCGFGGTFSIKNPETSSAMVEDKCRCVEETDASFCAALDSSCLLQIGGALSRRRAVTRPIHVAEILASQ